VHDQLPVIHGDTAEKLVQPIEEFRRFTRAAPFGVTGGDAFPEGTEPQAAVALFDITLRMVFLLPDGA
jgi:hypothetical protein